SPTPTPFTSSTCARGSPCWRSSTTCSSPARWGWPSRTRASTGRRSGAPAPPPGRPRTSTTTRRSWSPRGRWGSRRGSSPPWRASARTWRRWGLARAEPGGSGRRPLGPRAEGDPVARVRFVLMRPRNGGNLGAAARALKNFGLSDWAWVAPSPALDWSEARKRAVHAEDLLDAAVRRHSLADAVADCAWVVGTSSRAVPGRRRLSPRDAAEEALRRAASGTVAVVFGDERSGLTNAE